jgi:hypothetical protein
MIFLATILLLSGTVLFAQEKTSEPIRNSVAVDDSTTEAESDTREGDEGDYPWLLSTRLAIEKNSTRHGVSLSGMNSTLRSSVSILHENGFYGGLGWSSMLGSDGGPLNWSAYASYDYSLTDWLDLSAGISHTKYLVDSINAISDLENSLSFDITADLATIDLGFSFEVYLGSDPAKYWSADVGHTFTFGSLSVGLSAWLTYMSQKIDAGKLSALAVTLKKSKLGGDSTLTKGKISLSGISSYSFDVDIRYDLGAGFKVYINPSYMITPKGEVSSRDRQLWWAVGVRYSAEF